MNNKALFVIVVAIWAAVIGVLWWWNPGLYETQAAKELFVETPAIPLEQNGDVYYQGLFAPRDEDPFDFGTKIYTQTIDWDTALDKEERKKAHSTVFDENKIMVFYGNADKLECWIQQETEEDCLSRAEVENLIYENNILLNRLEAMANYHHFDSEITILHKRTPSGADFISLGQLFFAKLHMMILNNKTDEAIDLWTQNANMLSTMLRDQNNLVEKAIISIPQRQTLSFLPLIIENAHLTNDQYDKIYKQLDSLFSEDIETVVKTALNGDYHHTILAMENYFGATLARQKGSITYVLGSKFAYNATDTRNIFARFSQDPIRVASLPHDKAAQEFSPSRYKPKDVPMNIFNVSGRLMLGGIVKGNELAFNWKNRTVYARLMSVYAKAMQDNVEPQNMEAFLQTAAPNPYTNKPFEWDADSKEIFFNNPFDDEKNRYSVLYRPQNRN